MQIHLRKCIAYLNDGSCSPAMMRTQVCQIGKNMITEIQHSFRVPACQPLQFFQCTLEKHMCSILKNAFLLANGEKILTPA